MSKSWLALVLCCAVSAAQAENFMLFTDSQNPFTNAEGHAVVYLDRVKTTEEQLSELLVINPKAPDIQAAKQQLSTFLTSSEGQFVQQELLDAYAGLASAWSLGITHVPAVAANGYVVYGEPDVLKAQQLIRYAIEDAQEASHD